jgi:hypothetical protein
MILFKNNIIKKMSGGGGSVTISLNGLLTGVLVIGFLVIGYFALVGWKSAIITKWNSFFVKRSKDSDSESESEEEEVVPKKKSQKRRK